MAGETGLLAQPPDTLWTRTFGDPGIDAAMCVRQTRDGAFVAAGYAESPESGIHALLMRFTAQGDPLWSREYGGLETSIAYSVLQTADSGYVLAGYTSPVTTIMRGLLIRTNSRGDTLWTRQFRRDQRDLIMSVQPTQDGGCILAGYSRPPASTFCDGWLIRTDAAGDTLWNRTFGGADDDHFYEACQTFDGGFVAAGYCLTNLCFWLLKTDENGDSLWSRTFCSGGFAAEAHSVQQTADSGFVIAGWADIRSTGNFDFWLIRTDANGDSVWSHAYGGSADELAYCVQTTHDSGFVIAGGTGFYQPTGIRVVRTDAAGDSLWCLALDDIEGRAQSVVQAADGGYILAGYYYPAGSIYSDGWLAGLAPESLQVAGSPIPHPSSFILSVYPNPFNPSTEIVYDLPAPARVSLRVFDLLGREVRVLVDGFAEAGTHRVMFDGRGLASGIYVCRLQAGTRVESRKLVLLK
jgi:hypothetical protein